MRLLDKYILKAFVGPFLFGVFAFTSIFVGTGTLFRIAQYITEYGAPLLLVTRNESFLFSDAEYYFIDISYVRIAWFVDGF